MKLAGQPHLHSYVACRGWLDRDGCGKDEARRGDDQLVASEKDSGLRQRGS